MTDGAVVAVASAKGGVGKTTTSINLGAAIVANTPKSALLVEGDLGMANVLDFLDLPHDPRVDPSLHEVLAGTAPAEAAIVEAANGLAVLPSGDDVEGFRRADPRNLGQVVQTVRREYDVVVIDTPAGVSLQTLFPLSIADGVVLVSNPRVSAIRDTKKTKTLTERVGGTTVGLVLTMTGTGTAPSSERLADFLEVPLVAGVPDDPAVASAQDAGRAVVDYKPNAPASQAYYDAAKELGFLASEPEESRADAGYST